MNNVLQNKKIALNEIIDDYIRYNGEKSFLELKIESLKNKLTQEDYDDLIKFFHSYKNYFVNMMANTKKVFVKLSDNKNNDLKELEELEKDFNTSFDKI